MKTTRALKFLLGASALSLPLLANSESNYQNGAGALTATAHVDFSVVIPKILYLRVGTGSAYATTAALASVNTIDLITFAPALGAVGNGVAVPGTGGDIATGGETAALVSNAGNVVLSDPLSGGREAALLLLEAVLGERQGAGRALALRQRSPRHWRRRRSAIPRLQSPSWPPPTSSSMPTPSGRSRTPTPRRCRAAPMAEST